MTETPHVPSPARDLVRIHRVITRGLGIAMEKATQFKKAGFPDERFHEGFCDYARSLAIVLDGHHQGEDTIMFPTLRKKLPQAPYEHLAAQHKLIEGLLVDTNRAIDDLSAVPANGFNAFLNTLQKITEVWNPHIRMEESIFSHEALSEAMSDAEQGKLAADIGKFSQEHSIPPYLIVPFVLFNLNSEDRAALLMNMPPTLLDEMVLKAWKDQWAPMKPFLLE
jgi:hemerythrin-like domain-containing protein